MSNNDYRFSEMSDEEKDKSVLASLVEMAEKMQKEMLDMKIERAYNR